MLSEVALRRLPARKAYRELANAVLREAASDGVELAKEKQHFRRAVKFHEEVFNGGLSQYFTNSSGREYRETLGSLELIGALKQREILQRCVDVLAPAVDLTDRNEVGRHVFGHESVQKQVEQLDKEYYATFESFYPVMVDYAFAHKTAFQIK